MLLELVYFVGLIKIFSLALRLFLFFKRHLYNRHNPNLAEKYGKGSWAVVTGASDGMGAEYCR